jgi:general stress protein 26
MTTKATDTFYDKINDFDIAMLVTRAESGELRSRPMAVAGVQEGGGVYFVTSIDAEKVDEVEDFAQVNISAQKKGVYLSASGKAEIVDDQSKINELWSKSWKVWFPKGPEDPKLTLMRVEPSKGEYWDMRGADALRFAFEAGRALINGEPIKEDIVEHQKVDFSQAN